MVMKHSVFLRKNHFLNFNTKGYGIGMKKVLNLKGLVVGAFLCGLISSAVGETAGVTSFPRAKTLYLGGSQWGDPSTFNPMADASSSAWPVRDRFNLMYETLISFNTLNGKMESGLGTLVSNNADSIVIDINPAAKWSDGTPVTSKDVKFVFEIGNRFKSAPQAFMNEFISRIEVRNVKTNGAATERCVFMIAKNKSNNPLIVLDNLATLKLAPAHVFEKLLADNNNDLSAVQKLKMDANPVVSGPYTLETYSNEKIVLKRRNDYWGNKAMFGGKMPVPEFIIHPIFKSNDHFALALQKGELDASQTYMARIWLKQKDGVSTWMNKAPYFMAGVIPVLLINTTKAPLNDKNFRRAMASAVNYADVKELAVCGYSADIQPGLIMPTSLERKFINADDSKQYGTTYNLETAKKILKDAGYKSVYKADGTLDYTTDKDGKRLPTLFIKVPAGWSDWEAMVTIAVKGMRAAGIDAREGPVDASLYWPALPSGDFDLIMHKPAPVVTPSLPWSRFNALMASRNWVPAGGDNKMNENQGRYNSPKSSDFNPVVDKLINAIPTMTDENQIKDAYRQLNKIFMEDQPAIPLCYLPEQFYEYSTKVWKNWPTEGNPYEPPLLPMMSVSTRALWKLQLVK
jgi:peptide/nickel transport system substrate-binding protein